MENGKKISVAIDGPSGAGKSTIARRAAQNLGFVYVDTGAIYRSVGYHTYFSGVDPVDKKAVAALLPGLRVSMDYGEGGLQRMYRNGEDVTDQIRLPEVSMITSHISAIPEVRAFLLEMQRHMAREYSVVMDGRDIGTVVLPDADVKIFLTASTEDRARRRYKELLERGTPQSLEELLRETEERDYNDSHRAVSPLRPADGAVLLDTTGNTFEQSLHQILAIIKERTGL